MATNHPRYILLGPFSQLIELRIVTFNALLDVLKYNEQSWIHINVLFSSTYVF